MIHSFCIFLMDLTQLGLILKDLQRNLSHHVLVIVLLQHLGAALSIHEYLSHILNVGFYYVRSATDLGVYGSWR